MPHQIESGWAHKDGWLCQQWGVTSGRDSEHNTSHWVERMQTNKKKDKSDLTENVYMAC